MKQIKKILAIVLSIVMMAVSTLPSQASVNDAIESITNSKIIEQLKEDLGTERVEEILDNSLKEDSGYVGQDVNDLESELDDESLVEDEPEEEIISIEVMSEKEEETHYIDASENLIENETDNEYNNSEEGHLDFDNDNVALLDKDENSNESSEIENTIIESTTIESSYESSIENIIASESDVDEVLEIGIDDINEIIATISDLEKLKLVTKNDIGLFGTNDPNIYIFTKDWASACGINKADITKIIFQKGGELPSGTEFSIGTSGLKGYTNGTEVTIFAPNANDEINADTDSSRMFSAYETGPFNLAPEMSLTSVVGLNNLNTSNVRSMNSMFLGCTNISNLNLSSFDTSNVQDFGYMFYNCNGATSIDVSGFNTSNAINFGGMFQNCSSINSIDISNFDYSLIDSTDHTDYSTFNLTFAENASTALMMGHMFDGCSSVTTINMGNVNASNCRNFASLFKGCGNLLTISYSDFDVSAAISLSFMFHNCSSLTSIDLSKFNTSNVEYSQFLFGYCSNLQTINVSDSFTTSQILYSNGMFSNCTSIVGGNGTTYDSMHIDKEYARVDASGTAGYFTYSAPPIPSAPVLSNITVNIPPITTRYIKGTNFDPTGLKINLSYSDSTTETVTYSNTTSANFTFNGVSTLTLNTVGNPFEITIGYAGKTCVQNVIVAELSSIAIATHPTKLNYNAGDTFDPTGLVITLTYSDNVTQPIAYNTTTSSDFTFSPTGALTRTGNVITIQYKTYNTMTMEEILNVKELTSITIATNPTKLSYASGQSLNPNGLVLTLTYTNSNNVTSTNTVTYNNTTQNKFTFNPSGALTSSGNVTITYDGKTGANLNPTFAVTVYQVASISVVSRPTKTSYNAGSKLNPNGLVIKVNKVGGTSENIAYTSSNASNFTFNPSLSTNLNTGHTSVTVTYGGKSTAFAISVTQSSGGYVPSGGGGSTGGGGGGGGGGGIPTGNNPLNNTPTTTQVAANKSISATISGDTSSWVADPISGKWKLNVTLGNGQVAPASNGFYLLTNTITEVMNGIIVPKQVNNTYYFDVQGNMVTGWVQTADSKWYFFENAKTAEEGKMSIGWKQVQGSWYYFTLDGSMMASGITPDGFIIGADGKWVQ